MKEVSDFPDYRVTLDGYAVNKHGKRLKPDKTGCVSLRRAGITHYRQLGRLVWRAYGGPQCGGEPVLPRSYCLIHIDGDLQNNRRSNLKKVKRVFGGTK